ncbi:MAG: KTSC domain-containing protein, partial [Acidobacteriota bacterium]|nr:KTSC domain-containing protein [Acidobacteriota bacterium]
AIEQPDASAEHPNTFGHYLDVLEGYLPTPSGIANGLKEWWHRGDNIDSASQARDVLSKMHREASADPTNKGLPPNKWKVRPPTPDEQSVIERGMNADLGSTEGQNPLMQPAVSATGHAMKGDYAGAAADLTGGYAIPAAVPVLGEKAMEVAPTVKAVVKGAAQGAKEGATAPMPINGHSMAAQAARALGVGKVPAPVASALIGKYGSQALLGPFIGPEAAGMIGEVGGAAAPIVRGAWSGGKQALEDLRTPPSVEVVHSASWPPEASDEAPPETITHKVSFEKPANDAPATPPGSVPAHAGAPAQALPSQDILDRLKLTPEDFKALPPDQQADIMAVAKSIQSPVGKRPAPPVDLATPPPVEQEQVADAPRKSLAEMLAEDVAAKKAARLAREAAAPPPAQPLQPTAQAAPAVVGPASPLPKNFGPNEANNTPVLPGHTAVASEAVHSAGFNPDTGAPEIHFRNGSLYRYPNLPPAALRDAIQNNAQSMGALVREKLRANPEWHKGYQKIQIPAADAPALPGVEPAAPPVVDAAPMPPVGSAPAPQQMAPAPSVQPLAEGGTASVYTPKGTKADVQYQLVSAPQVRTSFMGGGDPEFQPRSTDRAGSRQRIEQRKGDLNPAQMGDSVNAGDGAPIMLPDGQLLTRNHGTQALNELYATPNSPKAAEYKGWLQANAQRFGIDPAVVASEPQPVLVRKILTPGSKADYAKFGEEANMSSVARMSDAEQAQMLAKRINGPVMDAFDPQEDGTPNPEFVRSLLTGLPPEEQAAFMDAKGRLSQTGLRNIRNAIFAKAYPDTSAIERMSESTDDNVRNISNGMLRAAPEFAKLQEATANGDRFPLSIAEDAAKAAEIMDGLREQNMTPQQWLAQQNVFGRDPIVDKLVEIFSENRRSPRRIGDVLKEYTKGVDALGSPKQSGLFGAIEPPTEAELLEAAHETIRRRNAANEEAPLFQEPQPPNPPGNGGSPGANVGAQPQAQPPEASQPPPAVAPPPPSAAPRGKRVKPKLSSGNFEPGFPGSPEIPRNPYA